MRNRSTLRNTLSELSPTRQNQISLPSGVACKWDGLTLSLCISSNRRSASVLRRPPPEAPSPPPPEPEPEPEISSLGLEEDLDFFFLWPGRAGKGKGTGQLSLSPFPQGIGVQKRVDGMEADILLCSPCSFEFEGSTGDVTVILGGRHGGRLEVSR